MIVVALNLYIHVINIIKKVIIIAVHEDINESELKDIYYITPRI